ncbi:LAQU0S01e12068g1_1 [Lachancea quebecensis]|uniref:LAQU0S01e12068g1_1 n=1 Tax=Lachancea quebecensis TaxID=1654605 RepID=A0A0P1KMI5_9SACH|nr:LAQU0S01e12068g1_1 [Lachancea quebecensis]
MCGRYALDCSGIEVGRRLDGLDINYEISEDDSVNFETSYNIAPTQTAPVLTSREHLKIMNWGLVPHWTKNVVNSQPYKTFNARKENLATSKMWTTPCNYKRCVVPVSGYYEWQTKGKTKIPYYVTRKDRELIFLAGMYDHVEAQDFYSYTVVTGPAPPELEWLHSRMPVVLERGSKEWNAWLNESKTSWNESELEQTLKARCDTSVMEWWQVSSKVGKVSNNGECLISPAKGAVRDFFKKEDKTNGRLIKDKQSSHFGKSLKQEEEEERKSLGLRQRDERHKENSDEHLSKTEEEGVEQKSRVNQKAASSKRSIENMLRNSINKRQKN